MQLRVLGCSGGIGAGLSTTALLVDDDVLIDAGTGVGTLDGEALGRIDHVFLTHSHIDHIAFVPLLIDAVARTRDRPVVLYGLAPTLTALREHIFNGTIAPDFSRLPSSARPSIRYQPIAVGETVVLSGRRITALPASHSVPAVGYQLDSGRASLVFTGDSMGSDAFWEQVNRIANLRYVIIETAFPEAEQELARDAAHLNPSRLAHELNQLARPAEIYVTHLKPDSGAVTTRELAEGPWGARLHILQHDYAFEF